MIEDVLSDAEQGMQKAIEAFKRELSKVRTGRANLSLLDNVKIDYYGSPTPLNQVASLNVAEARLITIKPFDKGMLAEIDKAIQKSGFCLLYTSPSPRDATLSRMPSSA